MALTVEDGTGKAGANSYITLAEARAYAVDRGVALSAVDATLTALLVKAADYLESKASEFVGTPTDIDQVMSWPRSGVYKADGSAFPDDAIPNVLKYAQCQLVIEQSKGIDLMPTVDNSAGFVTFEKVDVLETHYSESQGTSKQPIMPAVEALLQGLLRVSSGFALRAVRV